RRLLFDRAGNGVLQIVDLIDDLADLGDGVDGAFGVGLDGFDLAADVVGGLGGLLGQFLDLVGDHGKALAGLTGAGRFDGGVEGQKVRLLGDAGDDFDDVADLGAAVAELGDDGIGLVGNSDR